MALGTGTLADGVVAQEGVTLQNIVQVGEGSIFHGVFSYVVTPGGVVGETLKLTSSFAAQTFLRSSMSERVALFSNMQLGLFAGLHEGFTLTSAFVGLLNHIFAQSIKMSEAYHPALTYNLTTAEKVRLISFLDIHNAASFGDAIHIHESQPIYALMANAMISDTLRLSVDMERTVVLRITADDALVVEDQELVNGIWQGTLADNISMEILLMDPSGSVLTWAINTRTQAITQYGNWGTFNSFGVMGVKYVAADSNGLYELNGAQDITTPIIASMAGGYFQPNGSKFAGLKGVYIGAVGAGTYLLKLITGDGIERVYKSALNPNLMTTKVNIGKGLRSRYISWELITNDGQDFDLDTIEFVPMMYGRRV